MYFLKDTVHPYRTSTRALGHAQPARMTVNLQVRLQNSAGQLTSTMRSMAAIVLYVRYIRTYSCSGKNRVPVRKYESYMH